MAVALLCLVKLIGYDGGDNPTITNFRVRRMDTDGASYGIGWQFHGFPLRAICNGLTTVGLAVVYMDWRDGDGPHMRVAGSPSW